MNLFKQVLPTAFALLLLTGAAHAQVKETAKAAAPAAGPATPAQFRQEFIKASEEYQASLKDLAASYEQDLSRLTEQNGKLKELYRDGIISRKDMEANDASVAEARAKVEDLRKQIEQAAAALEAAKKAPAEPAPSAVTVASAPSERPWTTGNRNIDNLIKYYGGKYGVDPYLVYCVMHQESRFGAGATSSAGAQGLMQLMPGTAARYGVTNPYDPAQSIMGGTRYLKDLLNLFGGRVDLALAGYNAGEGAVMKYGRRVPPYAETQAYVRIIGTRYGQTQHAVQPTAKTAPRKQTR